MPKFTAKQMGFFEGRRVRPGDVFDAPEGFKAKWATPAPAEAKVTSKPPPAKSKETPQSEPRTFSDITRQAAAATPREGGSNPAAKKL